MDKVEYNPTLYMKSNKPTEYKTLTGQCVSPIQPGNIRECRDFLDKYRDISGPDMIFGLERFLYQYLSDAFPDDMEYDKDKIKLWSLDIETSSENGFPKPEEAIEEVLLISLKNFRTKKTITFGSRPYTSKSPDVTYVDCKTEYDLIHNFITWWKDVEPEVITGWNVDLFDMTYLCNRINRLCGERKLKELSPFNIVKSTEVDRGFGKKSQKYNICGVSIIDYLDVYKKFTYTNRESYRLDVIAEIELGQKKLDHSEFDTFKDFYTNDWEKFVDYNIHDVDLVDELEEKMKLIDLIMLMAYDAKVNYIDTFAQVRLWDVIIYNYLKKKNIVLDLIKRRDKHEQYAGAYVKEPVPGAYDWVVSFDLNSLYPSLIRFLNISPETLQDEPHRQVAGVDVTKLVNKEIDIGIQEDTCVAANGAVYTKNFTGMLPNLVRKIYDERVQYKKTMLRYKQDLVDIETEMKRRNLK